LSGSKFQVERTFGESTLRSSALPARLGTITREIPRGVSCATGLLSGEDGDQHRPCGRHQGWYYLIGSGLTSWSANPNKYATATDLKGPWSEFRDIAPPATKTYNSQSTLLLKVVGSDQTTVIFMGDQWKPAAQWDSRYLWMPVEIGGGQLRAPAAGTVDDRRAKRRRVLANARQLSAAASAGAP
jgi:hypothetical protein